MSNINQTSEISTGKILVIYLNVLAQILPFPTERSQHIYAYFCLLSSVTIQSHDVWGILRSCLEDGFSAESCQVLLMTRQGFGETLQKYSMSSSVPHVIYKYTKPGYLAQGDAR